MSWYERLFGSAPRISAAAEIPPPAGIPAPRSIGERRAEGRYYGRQLANDEATDATPLSVKRTFEAAARGETSTLIDLYKHSRLLDDRLDAPCATRVNAISGRGWVIKPPPGYASDPQAIEVAKNVATILNETRGFGDVVAHLAHGVLEHLAVLQHAWRKDHRGWWVSRPFWEHPNRFAWQLPTIVPMWSTREQGDHAGKPLALWPDQFIVHAPVGGRSDYPWNRGAMRSRVSASVVKRHGFKWWLKMLERWGQPQVYAERSPDAGGPDDTETDDQLLAFFRQLGSQWHGVVPNGTEIKTIPGAVAENLHRMFVEYNDTGHALAILGQNLSTEISKGGSFAAAKVHNYIRLDILASDLSELAETITDQWIEPLVRYNWPGAPVPYIDFIIGAKAEITVQEYMAGLYSADEVRDSKGRDPEEGGVGKRYYEGKAPTTKVVRGKPVTDEGDAEEIDVEIEEPADDGEDAPADSG
jgi:phage gp29-like protein